MSERKSIVWKRAFNYGRTRLEKRSATEQTNQEDFCQQIAQTECSPFWTKSCSSWPTKKPKFKDEFHDRTAGLPKNKCKHDSDADTSERFPPAVNSALLWRHVIFSSIPSGIVSVQTTSNMFVCRFLCQSLSSPQWLMKRYHMSTKISIRSPRRAGTLEGFRHQAICSPLHRCLGRGD